MDNLSHSLIGAVAGEMAAHFVPTAKSTLPEATRRNLFMTLMVVGNNLPDSDLLYTGILRGNLGYLLHHRGHTHTLIGAVVGSLLMFAASLCWLHRRRIVASAFDRYWLAIIALLAPLMHLAMDFSNSYGVHPFWPFDNRWVYGDSVFIVEPLFWAAAAPLVFLLRSTWRRAGMALILVGALYLCFGFTYVLHSSALAMLAMTMVMLLVGWFASRRTAAMVSFVSVIGVLAMFLTAGRIAHNRIHTLVTQQYPDAVLLDSVLTPMPVNPLCWDTILVQLDGDNYSLRRVLFSIAPELVPAAQCPHLNVTSITTLNISPVTAPDTAALEWHGEAVMSRAELQAAVGGSCDASALSRFARALWFQREDSALIVGDLRFDREAGTGFAEVAVTADSACPSNVPPWTPPRIDVL